MSFHLQSRRAAVRKQPGPGKGPDEQEPPPPGESEPCGHCSLPNAGRPLSCHPELASHSRELASNPTPTPLCPETPPRRRPASVQQDETQEAQKVSGNTFAYLRKKHGACQDLIHFSCFKPSLAGWSHSSHLVNTSGQVTPRSVTLASLSSCVVTSQRGPLPENKSLSSNDRGLAVVCQHKKCFL